MISPSLSRTLAQERERGITLTLTDSWHRVVLGAIVALSAVLNVVGLAREGYSNEFYAAAVRSMSESWHNFFFNSFDPGGFVTIDKPPLGFWFQVASVKVFGFNGVALLLPQALAGVLSVALLYQLVARTFGRSAGLISALALAVTPISIVTNRNNTIDSSLVLVVLLGAWAVLKAADTGRLRWLLTCAVLVGLGFNIKMLEAYLVVPAFGLVYLLGARLSLWRRLSHLALAAVVLVAVSLSWATAVDLTAASQRPWVDSTTTNSELILALGYNGLQRLTGQTSVSSSTPTTHTTTGTTSTTAGGPGGAANGGSNTGPGGVGENGATGVLRLLNTHLGSQIGWLLPLAVLGLLVSLWQTRPRFQRLDERQRSLVLWGTWLLTTGAFFSVALFFHTYYLVMVAPAISALAGIAVVALWQAYRRPGSKLWWVFPLGVLGAAGEQIHLLAAYPAWSRWLTPLLIIGSALAAIGLVLAHLRPVMHLRLALSAATVAVLALMAPSAAFASYTMQHTQTGAILRAGPTTSGISSGFGGGPDGPGGGSNRPGFGPPPGNFTTGQGGTPPAPPSGNGPTGQANANGAFGRAGATGTSTRRNGATFGGGPGGDSANTTLITYLKQHRGSAKYLVVTTNSNSAAPIIIATGQPVMALGGFTGSDPILTTAKFASLVKAGVVRYFLITGGGPGGPGASSGITTWIQQHAKTITVGGTQLYEYTG